LGLGSLPVPLLHDRNLWPVAQPLSVDSTRGNVPSSLISLDHSYPLIHQMTPTQSSHVVEGAPWSSSEAKRSLFFGGSQPRCALSWIATRFRPSSVPPVISLFHAISCVCACMQKGNGQNENQRRNAQRSSFESRTSRRKLQRARNCLPSDLSNPKTKRAPSPSTKPLSQQSQIQSSSS
jgi:hypothetical protein